MNKAIFLDKDGVIIDAIVKDGKPFSARNMSEVIIRPETIEGCFRLKEKGFKLLGFTNCPDIARGLVRYEVIMEQNRVISDLCGLDWLVNCPHDNDDNCACRKPKPGMIYAGAVAYEIDLSQSYVIGDRWSDIEAGAKAGIPHDQLYFIDYNYKERLPSVFAYETKDTFTDCVNSILKREVK